ncbi:MAG: EamA family transporter [Treponema sp.]|nr:EamA family transporter [Treponema sp.]MBR5033091.1 EamA family transporter [Treponema sp.]
MWILLVLLYGLLKGGREIAKKKAMSKNTVMEVLFVYTLMSFVFVLPEIPQAGGMEPRFFGFIALKSFVMFLAWIFGFYSLKKMPVSLYGVLSLSRVLFSTFSGVIFLHEILKGNQIAGLVIVCAGLLLLRVTPGKKNLPDTEQQTGPEAAVPEAAQTEPPAPQAEPVKPVFIILAFASCILNAVSGFMDKILMRDITSSQLQFWYMLFLVIYYGLFMLIRRIKINPTVFKNVWVWALAIMFVIGDKALFIANGMEASRITIMTLIKQSACLVTIIGGKIFFKEEHILYRLFCAAIILGGIGLSLISL